MKHCSLRVSGLEHLQLVRQRKQHRRCVFYGNFVRCPRLGGEATGQEVLARAYETQSGSLVVAKCMKIFGPPAILGGSEDASDLGHFSMTVNSDFVHEKLGLLSLVDLFGLVLETSPGNFKLEEIGVP